MGEEKLKKLFGEEFLEKYRQIKSRAAMVPERKLAEIRDYAMRMMRDQALTNPEFDFRVKYGNLDILMVSTPEGDTLREIKTTSSGNYKVTMIWNGSKSIFGPFVAVFIPAERRDIAEMLTREPGEVFFIVGKLKEQFYQGDITYSFRLLGVIPIMEEEVGGETSDSGTEVQ